MPPFPFAASDEINRILYATVDPTVEIDGQPIPALTTLLLGVCGNDTVKFTEATRLVRLFIVRAMVPTQDLRDGPNSTAEIVRRRLADGRTIADADVHSLVAEIDRLRAIIRGGSA